MTTLQVCEENGVPASNTSRIVRVSQLNGPRCVLVGDAGHSVTPALGQVSGHTCFNSESSIHSVAHGMYWR